MPKTLSDEELAEQLATDLKAWQQVSGLSYRDVSEMLHVALSTVHAAFAGTPVSDAVRRKLADMLYRGEGWRSIYASLAVYRQQYARYRKVRSG